MDVECERCFERQVDSTRAVLHGDERLGRQRLERLGHRPGEVEDGTAGLDVRVQCLELRHLLAQRRLTGLGLDPNPLEPLLHVLGVGHQQLQPQLLEIPCGIRPRREGIGDGEQGVRAAEVPEQRSSCSGHVLNPDLCERHLWGAFDLGDASQPLVRDGRHADVRLRLVHIRPGAREFALHRLDCLAKALGDKPYLDGARFTAGDLMMTTVLRIMPDLVTDPRLTDYVARCTARPAFRRALNAQLGDFREAA